MNLPTYKEQKEIVLGKLVDKTIEEDYEELSERLFGEGNCFNSSEVRKRMYGMKAMIEAIERDGMSANDSQDNITELKLRRDELHKEQQRFYDQRREYNKLISMQGRFEHLTGEIAKAASNLDSTVGKLYSLDDYCYNFSVSDNDAVLVLSDWHYGMTAENVWNTFNTEICKSRVKSIAYKAADRIRNNRCENLYIFFLGDAVNGGIHVSSRVASEELVADQLMEVSEILAQTIAYLSSSVPGMTYVHCTYGNHARTIQKKEDNIHRDNMERLIPWWLKWRLVGCDRVRVIDDGPDEFLIANVRGHDICAAHGDLDSVKSSPLTLFTLFNKRFGRNIEYILLGDKHHKESFEELGVEALMCGSLCGTDDYANGKRLYSVPSQLLFIVNELEGVDGQYTIKC